MTIPRANLLKVASCPRKVGIQPCLGASEPSNVPQDGQLPFSSPGSVLSPSCRGNVVRPDRFLLSRVWRIRKLCLRQRQSNRELRTFTLHTIDVDATVVLFDNLFHDTETEPGSIAAGCVERLENRRSLRRWNSFAIISHHYLYRAAPAIAFELSCHC